MPIISPSILNANFLQLGDEIEVINKSEADWVHLDIMDGVFVPNISFGIPVVEAVRKASKKPLDVHLMIVDPEKYLEDFRKAGADSINIHYEACKDKDIRSILKKIRQLGAKTAMTINPDTPVDKVFEYCDDLDMVLVMSVFPGFGGQKFIPETYARITKLKDFIKKNQFRTLIEVDGGVTDKNADDLIQAGADVLVSGSHIFHAKDPVETIHILKQIG